MAVNYAALSAAINGNNNKKVEYHSISKGDNFLHILPPWPGEKDGLPFHHIFGHYIVDPTADKETSLFFQCPTRVEGFCYICNRVKKLRTSEFSKDVNLATQIQSRVRYLFNALNEEGEIKVLEVGPQAGKSIIEAIEKDHMSGNDPFDYNAGLELNIRKTGKGRFDTKYEVFTLPQRKKLSPDVVEKISTLSNLYNVKMTFTNEELKKVIDEGNYDPKGLKKKQASEEEDADEGAVSGKPGRGLDSEGIPNFTPPPAPAAPSAISYNMSAKEAINRLNNTL